MLNNKYRVHEVAKDFKKNSKEITDILTKYADGPQEQYAGAGGPGAVPDLRVPDPAQPGRQHREHLRRHLS
ncbi:MAG: hypothetical protein ACLRWQ_03925 [Flavonifractor plautii]